MNISEISQALQPLKDRLLNHPLYAKIKSPEELHCFLETHVYAVWDFMSLLKALQQKLTCTTTPWFATPNADMRYLVNEIVLAEETDIALDGSRKSHFEMYLQAMKNCGADTLAMENFISSVFSLRNIFAAIRQSGLDEQVKDFLEFTFRIIEEGKTHKIASAFTFGREDLIPDMFGQILKNLQLQFPQNDLSELVYYFDRHIELDTDAHGPMANRMIELLCAEDVVKWQEVKTVAIEALEKRIGLWDAVEKHLEQLPQHV